MKLRNYGGMMSGLNSQSLPDPFTAYLASAEAVCSMMHPEDSMGLL